MKKSVLVGLLAAAGGAVYLLSKLNNKKEEVEEKKIITIESDDEENEETPQQEDDAEEQTEEELKFAKEEPQYSSEVQEINLMYPYLKPAFIAQCLKDQLGYEQRYQDNDLVTVCHDISFMNVEDLITFVRIMKEHGYQIEEAGSEQSLIISKDLIVEKGKILSDILNVSNQVACLNGNYENVRISLK